MSLSATNPTYLTAGPSKSGQVFAPNAQSDLEVAFVGVTTITLDGATKTGTINFIDGTQTIFAQGNSSGSTVAPRYVEASIVGGSATADLEAISINTGAVTTTGFTFYLTGAGSNADTLTVLFNVYK